MLQKAELSCEADSENYLGGSSETMYFIGLEDDQLLHEGRGRRRSSNSGGSPRILSGLAENTNSIFGDGSSEPEAANGCVVLLRAGTKG